MEMRMTHKSHVIHPRERRRSVIAKADLVHEMAVMVKVARILMHKTKSFMLGGIISHECFPNPK
jgi:hypothetical protein